MRSPFALKKTCLAVAIIQALAITPSLAADLLVDDGSDGAIDVTTGCTLRSAIVSINSAQNSGACVANGSFGVDDTINFNVSNIGGLISTLAITTERCNKPK